MIKIKRAYDLWDMPPEEQVKTPSPLLAPLPKMRQKPGPKPKAPIVPMTPETKKESGIMLIKDLVDELRKLFVKVDIREPKPRIAAPNTPPVAYISNIILDGYRIGFLEQAVDGNRVYLRFEKGANIPIWHDGDDISKFADKIKQEIEKHYTKNLAAKVGYRIAIKITAHRRRFG